MRKSQIQNVVIQSAQLSDSAALSDSIIELYIGYVERRLRGAGFTMKQKLAIIDIMIEQLLKI